MSTADVDVVTSSACSDSLCVFVCTSVHHWRCSMSSVLTLMLSPAVRVLTVCVYLCVLVSITDAALWALCWHWCCHQQCVFWLCLFVCTSVRHWRCSTSAVLTMTLSPAVRVLTVCMTSLSLVTLTVCLCCINCSTLLLLPGDLCCRVISRCWRCSPLS